MLPKIQQPLFELKIPSNGKLIQFRPYLVKEEKILLVAKASDDETDILRALTQIIKSCSVEDLTNENLTTFDVEYMFLKIRAKSVDNIVKLSYRDNEDDEVYKFEVNLDDIEILYNEDNNSKIKINEEYNMTMKYPSADIANKITKFKDEIELMYFFLYNCIDTIYNKDNVYLASDYSQEEITDFVENLPIEVFSQVKNFFETMPRLYHKIEYKNKNGNDRVIELKKLKDFFILG